MGKLTRPEGKPFWSAGPRLGELLNQLFGNIDGVDTRPTPAQVELFVELKGELKEVAQEVQNFFSQDVKRLNNYLQQNNIPKILVSR